MVKGAENPGDVMLHLFTKTIFAADENADAEFINLESQKNEFPLLLLLLNNISASGISEADLELLKKMADWLGIPKSEVVALNLSGITTSFQFLVIKHRIENIICYGLAPNDIGLQLDFRINEPLRFMGCRLLFTAPFFEIQQKGALKNKFFDAAKRSFSHLKGKQS
jgi:hypothetical protein